MKRLILLPLLAIMLMLSGCSTPRAKYNRAATAYNFTAIGLATYHDKKPFPAPIWEKIQREQAAFRARLAEAHQWLVANPVLADTPGSPYPPLDPVNIILHALLSQLVSVDGVVLVPTSEPPELIPLPAPTTQPGG